MSVDELATRAGFAMLLVAGATVLAMLGWLNPAPGGDEGTEAHLFQLAIVLLMPLAPGREEAIHMLQCCVTTGCSGRPSATPATEPRFMRQRSPDHES